MIFADLEKFDRRAILAGAAVGCLCLGAAGWMLFIFTVRLICRH